MQTLRACVFAAAAALFLVTSQAVAQTIQDGIIEGVVRDQTGAAVADASVSVGSASLVGGPRTAQTDKVGQYRVLGLPPGTYAVSAAGTGFARQTRTDLPLPPGRSITVDLVLPIAPVEQRTIVTAEPVAADTRSTSTSIVIDKTMLENLPLDRDVAQLVNLAPGVRNSSALGGATLANPMQIDDMSANDAKDGTPAMHPNLYWIQEAQMIGAGADARYGDYTGMLMNLVTRSGTDHFSGVGQYQVSRNGWVSNNRGSLRDTDQHQFAPLQIVKRWDGFGQFGGPIYRQRLWFFGGWERYRDDIRPAAFSAVPRTADEPNVDATENNGTLKLTGAATNTLRIEGLLQHIQNDRKNFNAAPTTMRESLIDDDDRETLDNISGTWIVNSATLIEARGGMNNVTEDLGPSGERRLGPPGHIDAVTGVESVNATGFSVRRSRVASAAVSLTRFADDFLGREHKFMFGAQFEHTAARSESGYPGGILYYDYGGAPYLAFEYAGSSKRPHGSTTTVYAQDAWRLASRVTITPGVRVAFDSGAVQEQGHVMSEHSTSPRIGLAWDVTGSHHTIVRAHYGHYHETFATAFYDFLDPGGANPFIEARVAAPGVLVPLGDFSSDDVYQVDPDFRIPYVREIVAAAEYAANQRGSITLQWIRRDFEHTAAFVRPDAIWKPSPFTDPGPDGLPGTGDDGAVLIGYVLQNPGSARWVLTNPSQAYHNHDTLQAIGRARLRNVEIRTSWAWSRTAANFAVNFNSNVALNSVGPFAPAAFTNPNALVNADATIPHDVDVKVLATWSIDRWSGLRVSGIYTFQSAQLVTRVVNSRGAGGGIVTLKADAPRRLGEATDTLDLRIDKPVPVFHNARAHILLDAFNVWNQGVAAGVIPISGPNFGLPGGWSAPRSFRVALRGTF